VALPALNSMVAPRPQHRPRLHLARRRIRPILPRMNLLERVENDLKEAMRARAADKLAVLRMLKSALKPRRASLPGAVWVKG
jgi:hypothetical protein